MSLKSFRITNYDLMIFNILVLRSLVCYRVEPSVISSVASYESADSRRETGNQFPRRPWDPAPAFFPSSLFVYFLCLVVCGTIQVISLPYFVIRVSRSIRCESVYFVSFINGEIRPFCVQFVGFDEIVHPIS